MCRDDLTLPMLLTPRLLLGVAFKLGDLAANDRAPVLRGERWRFVLKARRAPTLPTAAAGIDAARAPTSTRRTIALGMKLQGKNRDQSTPKSKGRRRRKAELLPFGAEDGPAPRYEADGDVRSTSRKDARKHQSPDLYAAMPISSAKPQRRRKPAGDLKSNKPRFVRARTTTSAANSKRTRRTLPAIVCFYAPMFGVLRDPEKDGGKTGPARTRTWRLGQLT